jgi:hypothetical protein
MLAGTTAHELFHAKSYKAARLDESGEICLYRSGISMVDRNDPNAKRGGEKEYFGKMEEAIVAECTKKFLQKIETDPLFRDETVAILKIKKWAVHYLRSSGVSEDQLETMIEEIKYIPNPQTIVQQVLSAYADEEYRSAYAAGMLHRLVEEKRWNQWRDIVRGNVG